MSDDYPSFKLNSPIPWRKKHGIDRICVEGDVPDFSDLMEALLSSMSIQVPVEPAIEEGFYVHTFTPPPTTNLPIKGCGCQDCRNSA